MSGTTMDLLGVNLAGAEFGSVGQPYGQGYIYPSHDEIDYEAAKGMNVIRLPFLWERLQPTLGGALDPDELARIDDVVNYAASKGLKVDLDLHDYGNYNGQPVGSAAVPNSAFAGLWGKLASHYAANSNVIFGLMNEPQQSSATDWLHSVNAAISAIRTAGATQEILVPGIGYDGAWTWTTGPNASAIGSGVVDPLNNYAFEVHQYLDSDGSGTHADVVSSDVGVQRLQAATQWAESTGHRLFLGEFGVASDSTSLAAMSNMLSYMDQHTGAWQGATYWAAGPWWGNYMYSAEPANGVDAAQMQVLEEFKHTSSSVLPASEPIASTGDPGQTATSPVMSDNVPVPSGSTGAPAETPPPSGTASATAPVTPAGGGATPSDGGTAAIGDTVPGGAPAAAAGDTTNSETAGTTLSPVIANTAPAVIPTVPVVANAAGGAQPAPGEASPPPPDPFVQPSAVNPLQPVAADTAPPSPATSPRPILTVDPSVTFGGPTMVTLSGTVSDSAAVSAIHVLAGATDLGAAQIAADGSWSLSTDLKPGFHTDLAAVATDEAGNTTSTATRYDLTTGIRGPGAKSSIDNYDASGAYVGTTQFSAGGGIFLQWSSASLANGNTQNSYGSGSSLGKRGVSSLVDTFDTVGNLVSEVQNVLVGGAHALTGAGAHDVFVFRRAFGQDLITDFNPSGGGHDVLSLPAEFGSVADVLRNATQHGANTVISAHNGDTVVLQGVAKADLKPQDLKFHP